MSTAYAGRSSTIQHTYIPATEKQSPATVSGAQHVQDRTRAVQQVYEAHIDSIYKFIYFKLGNREDAEDITSQVFIKAAHSLDVTQDERTQLAWLYQVARTTITDYWRHYYKAPTS